MCVLVPAYWETHRKRQQKKKKKNSAYEKQTQNAIDEYRDNYKFVLTNG